MSITEKMKAWRNRVILLGTLYTLTHAIHMDMSPHAVDDQFSLCRDKMLQRLLDTHGELNQELQASETFMSLWKSGVCVQDIPGGRTEHRKALSVYSAAPAQWRRAFNEAVQRSGSNASVYQTHFHYKALHFLLWDAMRLLRTHDAHCLTAFRGTDQRFEAELGSRVRFGRFTAALRQKGDAEESVHVHEATVFNITSCAAVDLESIGCGEDLEVLIPPHEMFEVEKVADGEDYREITLVSKGLHSTHDCYLFSSDPAPSSGPAHTNPAYFVCVHVCVFLLSLH